MAYPLRWFVALGLMSLAALAKLHAEDAPRFGEAKVKAAFVFSFARYIDWPPQCFDPPDAPFVIGVTSRSAVYEELQAIVSTRTHLGRAISLREIHTAGDMSGVQLLFVERGNEKLWLTELPGLASAGVVTIGESDRFRESGGMFTLHERDQRLRFMVNRDATGKSLVKVSSQLLKLADQAKRNL